MTSANGITSSGWPFETIHEWVFQTPADGIERSILVDDSTGAETSGATITKNSRRVASALFSRKLGSEAVVVVVLPNLPVVAEISLGTFLSGCTLSILSPALTPDAIAQKLKELDARILITVAGFPPDLSDNLGHPRYETILIGGGAGGTRYEEFISGPEITHLPDVSPDSVAMIFQSSGTTSPAKPIEMTHSMVVSGLVTVDDRMKLKNYDTALAVAPFSHVVGFYGLLLTPLRRGAKIVTVAPFTVDRIPDLIDRHEISIMAGGPPMMPPIASSGAAGRLGSLRKIYSGGGPLDHKTESTLRDAFPRAFVGQAYGLTEFMPLTMTESDDGHPIGTVGKLVDATAMKIIDPDDGHVCLTGEIGEIVVRGPQVMKGYRGYPEETAAVIDSDGWFHTADLGHVDSEGFLFLTGRLKEMITIQGKRVAPKAFQDLIIQMEPVTEVVVAGYGEDPNNQVPIAFVVGDESLTIDQVKSALKRSPELPNCEVVFVDAIPKSPAGKILRTELLQGLPASSTEK